MRFHIYKENIGGFDAIIHCDDQNDMYTVSYDGDGGAVITNQDLRIAKKDFVQSMQLASSLVKLKRFSAHGNFDKQA